LSREHELRLRRVFERVLFVSLGGAPVLGFVACSDDEKPKLVPIQATGGSPSVVFDACAPSVSDVLLTSVDGEPICYAYHVHECGIPEGIVQADAGCAFSLNDCQKLCPLSGAYVCNSIDHSCDDAGNAVYDGPFHVACEFCPSNIGRRPEGLALARGARAPHALGDHFARMSELEAASVVAFERMEQELIQHGAPRALIRDARRARRDEIRHAEITRQIAQRFGGTPRPANVEPPRERSLEQIAEENAVEGCVRETYGALVAHYQARRARDPEISRAMRRIAEDETRHAALGWAVAGWVAPRLSADARGRIHALRDRAIEDLQREILTPTPEMERVAGVPSAARERMLIRELSTRLW
jgi:hypothetical protein